MMKNKGLLIFIIAVNLICWVYGCLYLMWSDWSVLVLLGSVVNVASVVYCMTALAKGSRKGRITVCISAIMFAVYAVLYLAFDKVLTPLSFGFAGSFYGIGASVMKLANMDIGSNMQLLMGIGFIFCALAAICALLLKGKPSAEERSCAEESVR